MNAAIEMLTSLLSRGGWVMGPLLLLSMVSVTFCLERAWFWWRTHGRVSRRHFAVLTRALRSGRRDEIKQACLTNGAGIYDRTVTGLLTHGVSDAMVVDLVEEQRPIVERFMGILSTIITAAPMLGILGTVTGLINSFELLDEATRMTDPREISGGIAEALLTTAVGLFIAILTLFPYMVFKAQVERSYNRMEVLVASAREGLAEETPAKERPAAAVAVAL